MAYPTDDVRERLLAAAEQQLAASVDGDVSTRAVCAAVGVTQPVLYRIFGDKQGLLDALADLGLRRYADRKRELEVTDDPVADLRAGWVDHMAFADENPALYRLMFSPRPGLDDSVRDGVFELIKAGLRRCAAIGALRMDADEAAAMILSANIGLALNRQAQPAVYAGDALSLGLRSVLFAAILADPEPDARADRTPLASAARALAAQLDAAPETPLVPEERALLGVWLDRLG